MHLARLVLDGAAHRCAQHLGPRHDSRGELGSRPPGQARWDGSATGPAVGQLPLNLAGHRDLHQISSRTGQSLAAAHVGSGGQFPRHGIPGTGTAAVAVILTVSGPVAGIAVGPAARRRTGRHQMPVVDLGSVTVLAAQPRRCHHPLGQAHARRNQVVIDFGVGGVVPHGAVHRGIHRVGAATVIPQHMTDLMDEYTARDSDAPPLGGAEHRRIDIEPPMLVHRERSQTRCGDRG